MKVHVIGGGPAGLYYAILMKKAWPQTEITVFERNRPDDTFGFGVVFSDQTLDRFEAYDRESYRAIIGHFAYWDDIEIHFPRHDAPRRRQRLLRLFALDAVEDSQPARPLARRPAQVPDRRFADRARTSAAPIWWSRPTASIRGCARPLPSSSGRASTCGRTSSPGWARPGRSTPSRSSSARPSTASSSRTAISISPGARPGSSNSIRRPSRAPVSTSSTSSKSRSSSKRSSPTSCRATDLITNRSIWRNFPTIRCERWVHGNIVLLGDAKASAHFSIGSGTKLAMEDGIALFEAFRATGGREVKKALAHFETAAPRRGREDAALRRRVAGLVRARAPVLEHGPDALRLRADDALQGDHLRQPRAARAGVRRRGRPGGGARHEALGFEVDTARPVAPMFQPFRLRNMMLENRVVVSPMCQYSSVDGLPADWHLVHLRLARDRRRRADVHRDDRRVGGGAHHARLRRHVQRRARGGLEAHRRFRARAVEDQILHAARPRRTQGRDQADVGRASTSRCEQGAWPIVSASPLPYFPHSAVPREMTRADMDRVVADFVQAAQARRPRRLRHDRAARRARLPAGELHLAAHQPSHRRIRRLARKPHALSARSVPRHARGLAGREADVGAHLGDRLGRTAASPATTRSRSRGCSTRPAATSSTSRPARPPPTPSRCSAACSRRRSPSRSATRPGSPPCASARSPPPIRSTPSSRPAAPISSRWRGRIWSIRTSPCGRRPGTARAAIHCPPQYLAGKDQIFRNSVRDREDLKELQPQGQAERPRRHLARGRGVASR